MKYPVVERLRSLMGNAAPEHRKDYEQLAADAIERIVELEADLADTLRAVMHHFGPDGAHKVTTTTLDLKSKRSS